MKPSLNPNAPAFPAHGSQEELSAWAQRFSRRTSTDSFTADSRTSEELARPADDPISELPEDPFGMSLSPSSLNLEQQLSLGIPSKRIRARNRQSLDGRDRDSQPIATPRAIPGPTRISSHASLDRIPSFCQPSPTLTTSSWSSVTRGSNPELDLVMDAAQTGKLALLSRLPELAADELCDEHGRSAMYLVCEKKYGGPVIDELIKRGANIEATDPEGNTPLLLAVKNNQITGAVTLLLRNANPDAKDPQGRRAWQLAHAAGNLRLADTLQRFGASADESGEKIRTRLLDAMNDRNLDEVLKFASMFAGKEAITPDGRTALHLAAAEGDLAMMRTLLAAGLKPNVVDRLGNTPLHHAAASGSVEACQLLEKFGAFKDLKNSDGISPSALTPPLANASQTRPLDG